MIPTAHPFNVRPNIPERLSKLPVLANNLWWSWNADAVELFMRTDRELWAETYHSPVALLGKIKQERLSQLLSDEGYLAHLDRVSAAFEAYLADKTNTWYAKAAKEHSLPEPCRIAYFSMEYGIHESVPTYSGGLGCLAGDHLKSASDLGIPLMGIGLAYREGYFQQYLSADGWQQERYPVNDFYNMPFELQKGADGQPLLVDINLLGRLVYAQIWKVQVGRIPLYMLDTNIDRNSPEDRDITSRLYGGDKEMRIKQEILLGIGGTRAMEALQLRPTVTHINEGHAAFATIERIRLLMQEGAEFGEAFELVHATNVFTTHTPVPAGNEVFADELIEKYIQPYANEIGLSKENLLKLGNTPIAKKFDLFSMTVLALRTSAYANGVAQLHGEVAREMWLDVWAGVPKNDIPIDAITNGVHVPSWVSNEMGTLFTRYLGPRWATHGWDTDLWKEVESIPDAELWRTHERRRERLVAFARTRLLRQLRDRGALDRELRAAESALDPEVLTIGFARRFATYKRATLLFSDIERLNRILNNEERPVQIILAGKAHPHDSAGKELIKTIIKVSREPRFQRRIVFLENYDINVARYMVQGVDIWLNTPRRPQEASGTSGMKVSANGGLNCSILDGWWDEGYDPKLGWAIDRGETYTDNTYQDAVEAQALYTLFEQEIAPAFYDIDVDRVPHHWVARMKGTIRDHAPFFNTDRMVQEYTERFYLKGAVRGTDLTAKDQAKAKKLAGWRYKLRQHWKEIRIERVEADTDAPVLAGEGIPVEAEIALGHIDPSEVSVALYYGPLDSYGKLQKGDPVPMEAVEAKTNGNGKAVHHYKGTVPAQETGRNAFAVRVLPKHESALEYEPGLIVWG